MRWWEAARGARARVGDRLLFSGFVATRCSLPRFRRRWLAAALADDARLRPRVRASLTIVATSNFTACFGGSRSRLAAAISASPTFCCDAASLNLVKCRLAGGSLAFGVRSCFFRQRAPPKPPALRLAVPPQAEPRHPRRRGRPHAPHRPRPRLAAGVAPRQHYARPRKPRDGDPLAGLKTASSLMLKATRTSEGDGPALLHLIGFFRRLFPAAFPGSVS